MRMVLMKTLNNEKENGEDTQKQQFFIYFSLSFLLFCFNEAWFHREQFLRDSL